MKKLEELAQRFNDGIFGDIPEEITTVRKEIERLAAAEVGVTEHMLADEGFEHHAKYAEFQHVYSSMMAQLYNMAAIQLTYYKALRDEL